LLAKPSPLNINLGRDRFSMFNKKRDIPRNPPPTVEDQSRAMTMVPRTRRRICATGSIDTVLKAPMIAEPLGLYDCCGVSDGAACAIVTTPDTARGLSKHDLVTVKAVQVAVSKGMESQPSQGYSSH
jgi:acetyl-CoA acetyltransferase